MTSIDIIQEVQQNFIDSSYDVNTNRAFPDIRDGLKPGQRACLWEMYTKKYNSKKPHVKSAKISGGVAALWWPHGTTAIYETFARMSQPFVNNIPEVDFHGANGNVILGGDAIAADRYTEARLSPIVEEGMLKGVEKNTVPMILNFSEDEKWPKVLPAVFPRLLVNGAQGIGVSLSNYWCLHNFTETAQVIEKYLEDETVDNENYYPDFPTGGVIINKNDLSQINKTGKGRIIIESKYTINGKEINFYELPYQVYIEPVIDEIKKAIDENKIIGIEEIFNKSDKKQISLVVTVSKDFTPENIVAQLFQETNLRKQINVNQNGIVSKTPILINLAKYLEVYKNHNIRCIQNEIQFDIQTLQNRIEILEGLSKALEDIDNVIKIIKESKNSAEAKSNLVKKYSFTESQVNAILNMKLNRLANMERIAINNELQEKQEKCLELKDILKSKDKQVDILKNRLRELVKKFGDKRRTEVIQKDIPVTSKSKKAKEKIIEDVVVTFDEKGYVKSIPLKSYRSTRSEVKSIKARTDEIILFFSSLGKVYRVRVDNIKQCSNTDKGTAIGAILNLDNNEKILYTTSMNVDEKHPYIVFVSKFGMVKKSDKTIYFGSVQNVNGVKGVGLKDNDEYVFITESNGDYLTMYSSDNMALQIELDKINISGKASKGCIGMKLNDNQYINKAIVKSTENKKIPVRNRGGKGVLIYE